MREWRYRYRYSYSYSYSYTFLDFSTRYSWK
jgi:hypothetical protein